MAKPTRAPIVKPDKNISNDGKPINNNSDVKKPDGWHTTAPSSPSTTAHPTCPACAPKDPVVPDVVIPFFERDMCKLKYTANSLAKNDPDHKLGNVYLMWVSGQPAGNYMNQINEIQDIIKPSRGVHF